MNQWVLPVRRRRRPTHHPWRMGGKKPPRLRHYSTGDWGWAGQGAAAMPASIQRGWGNGPHWPPQEYTARCRDSAIHESWERSHPPPTCHYRPKPRTRPSTLERHPSPSISTHLLWHFLRCFVNLWLLCLTDCYVSLHMRTLLPALLHCTLTSHTLPVLTQHHNPEPEAFPLLSHKLGNNS